VSSSAAPDLARVERAFASWRSRRHHCDPIPDALWDQALALLDRHPISLVCSRLGLNHARLAERRRLPAPQAPLAFVALPPPEPPSPLRLLFERPDGARLSLELPPSEAARLHELCSAFLRTP